MTERILNVCLVRRLMVIKKKVKTIVVLVLTQRIAKPNIIVTLI